MNISGSYKEDARKTTVKGAWHRGIGDEWTSIISGDVFSSIVHQGSDLMTSGEPKQHMNSGFGPEFPILGFEKIVDKLP